MEIFNNEFRLYDETLKMLHYKIEHADGVVLIKS
jgi:hypothetical protein